MKVKFMSDYLGHKAGDVVEVAEDAAEDLHQAGRAYPYHGEPEPAKPVEAAATEKSHKRAVKR